MPDYQLDQIMRAAKRLESAARFEGIALAGKTSDGYQHRRQVTTTAWTALRAAVESSSKSLAAGAAGPARPRIGPAPGYRPQSLPSQWLEPASARLPRILP
jgi:hypothetical protein